MKKMKKITKLLISKVAAMEASMFYWDEALLLFAMLVLGFGVYLTFEYVTTEKILGFTNYHVNKSFEAANVNSAFTNVSHNEINAA